MNAPMKVDGDSRQGADNRDAPEPRILIMGAGASGMLMAIRLLQSGHRNFVIYEKRDRIGGTWRDNRYPGLHCDVPSQAYCYSFALNPSWSKRFSPGPEIQTYLEDVANRFDLAPYIVFENEVVDATFNEGRWSIRTDKGLTDSGTVLVAATGVLHHLNFPDIAGLRDFGGQTVHTGQWHDDIAVAGKRIGVIGTGATAAQIVPALVDEAQSLTLFQRTAQWIAPIPNGRIAFWKKLQYRLLPSKLRRDHEALSAGIERTAGKWVLRDDVEYPRLVRYCEENLASIADPELRRKLTPDYPVGCKRQIFSSTFYPALQRPNARLVTEPIARIEPKGVRTEDGALHELDLLVLATGYRMHDYVRPASIRVADGVSLEEVWRDTEIAHRTVAVPHIPNFFMIVGPNSPLTNFSVIAVAEMQVDYILKLIEPIRTGAARIVEPKREATDRFVDALRNALGGTVWAMGCRSYYLDRLGYPNAWPWTIERFRQDMSAPDFSEYLVE